ncbi:hypothetical protein JI739_20015 [Ramlibacter sp. AW1]|uniref:DUF3466 family protein n=1 Tax=Ramlibacter aurantiacus TaxID=2801330 RepID=A0A937D908_9BURK|nr:hypothetical protein [Ramlibacter aurantiacus]MBL0422631.1 hypothetical protein [Ramlibacter aurantiacus]
MLLIKLNYGLLLERPLGWRAQLPFMEHGMAERKIPSSLTQARLTRKDFLALGASTLLVACGGGGADPSDILTVEPRARGGIGGAGGGKPGTGAGTLYRIQILASAAAQQYGKCINKAGQVVGQVTSPTQLALVPVQWNDDGTQTILEDASGWANYISESGVVVGFAGVYSSAGARMWSNGVTSLLPVPAGSTAYPNCISDVAGIVGSLSAPNAPTQGVWWRGNDVIVPTPPVGTSSYLVQGINDSSRMVGAAFLPEQGRQVPVLWSNADTPTVLPMPSGNGWAGGSASRISSQGVVAGTVLSSRNVSWAARWVNEQATRLPVPPRYQSSTVSGTDYQGTIFGSGVDGAGGTQALMWTSDKVTILSDLIDPVDPLYGTAFIWDAIGRDAQGRILAGISAPMYPNALAFLVPSA